RLDPSYFAGRGIEARDARRHMTGTSIAVTSAALALVSWWLTGEIRRYALARGVLDIPNDRSSHSVATPRGGGMATVITVIVALAGSSLLGLVMPRTAIALAGAGALVAGVGFIDDHRHLARRWRFLGQLM